MTQPRRAMANTVTQEELNIERLGACRYRSPLESTAPSQYKTEFVYDNDRVIFDPRKILAGNEDEFLSSLSSLELVGPRKPIFFDPQKTKAAIVTCGGLCPGINDVIRSIVMTLCYRYGVHDIIGVQYGYRGFLSSANIEPIRLNQDIVSRIHHFGGSILHSSRGAIDLHEIVDRLRAWGVNILFAIGGDGTQRGALDIANETQRQGMEVSVVGIPKTIDNDIPYIDKSFGFETACSEAVKAVSCAHVEAKGAPYGIGIVKLMGRHSGFIACHAALAMNDANYVLIPEASFAMDGKDGFLRVLFERLKGKGHAVIVVAEGAGQDLLKATETYDASGNVKLGDIGHYILDNINRYAKQRGVEVNQKYIDPSYMIRSVPASPTDSIYSLILGENAVHAAMSGRTKMVVGRRHGYYVHMPMQLITCGRKHVSLSGYLWSSVLAATGQGEAFLRNEQSSPSRRLD